MTRKLPTLTYTDARGREVSVSVDVDCAKLESYLDEVESFSSALKVAGGVDLLADAECLFGRGRRRGGSGVVSDHDVPSRPRARRAELPAGACGEVADERDPSSLACGEALLCAEPAVWEVVGMTTRPGTGWWERRPLRRVCANHLRGVLGDNQLVRKVDGEWRRGR